jgi:pimeloyl-ACP methyl ester carboxylesterase
MWHLQQSLPYRMITPDYIDAQNNESLRHYAKRYLEHLLSTGAIDRDDDLVFVGASMGGAIAQEMATHISIRAIILTGSLRSKKELRSVMRHFGQKIAGSLPVWVYKFSTVLVPFIMKYLSGIPTDEVILCTKMYRSISKHFFREGYRMLSNWRGCKVNVPILRIHGALDHVIPFSEVVIKDAKHLVCLSHPAIVNNAIKDFIRHTSRIVDDAL